jgi:hypothetical protein
MRRAACWHIEIAGKLGHFPHESDEAAVAAAECARLALILDRPAHFVTSRQAVDFGAVFGQPRQKGGEVF